MAARQISKLTIRVPRAAANTPLAAQVAKAIEARTERPLPEPIRQSLAARLANAMERRK